MKYFAFILVLWVCVSCKYIEVQSKDKENTNVVVASVYDAKLYKEDIEKILPKNISKSDSLIMVKGIINSWAKQQLLLQKAEENISEVNNNEINKLVKNYRESLFVNGYKERLIKQQLDTIISNEEITAYYKKNKDNFKLNEELVQYKYIFFGKKYLDKNDAIKKFKSTKEEDLESLEDQTINFKSYRLRDSTWVTVDELMLKIPPFRTEPRENLLKISKFIQKEDSLGVYLVAVDKVLKRNDIAPLSYITPQIKQLILHKRKLELIREIEKTLINDAIENKHFKEY
ncbi:hypothetical protein [Tenacibaculum sp. UWU-22]|uniref:hypothetical protein n=1 Tax=Tenacibaculum sp. UWU-22 TaxID=3234187 RepID=UPI0034DAE2DA